MQWLVLDPRVCVACCLPLGQVRLAMLYLPEATIVLAGLNWGSTGTPDQFKAAKTGWTMKRYKKDDHFVTSIARDGSSLTVLACTSFFLILEQSQFRFLSETSCIQPDETSSAKPHDFLLFLSHYCRAYCVNSGYLLLLMHFWPCLCVLIRILLEHWKNDPKLDISSSWCVFMT